jgi:hypothetical protein
MEMTIENHGRGRSSQPEQLRPDGTLLTIKATPEERLCWDCATIGRVIVRVTSVKVVYEESRVVLA